RSNHFSGSLTTKVVTTIVLLIGLVLMWPANTAAAASPTQAQPDNAFCLRCHANPNLKTHFANGDVLSLYVDENKYNTSMHGLAQVKCVDCHNNITGFPHPPLVAADHRDFQMDRYPSCSRCHPREYELALDSMHARALAQGNRAAAVCVDCHGSHNVQNPDVPRQRISFACAECHAAIFDTYRKSVHGAALIGEGNPDVPTCIDCHGVHNIADPMTVQARLKSPVICGGCHGDPERMDKYGISTDVFDTYLADFHGTTVELVERISPDQPSNKAVCFDCHGIHDIRLVNDPEAQVVKENLVKTCRKCHPDATTNFPTSWTQHYRASREEYTLVWAVQWFYRLLIPGMIGFFMAFIALDAGRRTWDRWRRGGEQ
ncbi:MAG: cytochrome c3 family protein, partial [Anaerolineae bacterium]